MADLDLDVDAPEKVADVLRRAADQFRESVGELQSTWQDRSAGKVWGDIAKALDAAAIKVEQAINRHM